MAAFLDLLEGLGVVGAVVVEVDGGEEQSQDFREYILDRTDAVRVIATPVRGAAG